MDYRNHDGKLRPTVGKHLADYVRALHATGLFGDRPTDTARTLIVESIQRHVGSGLIKPIIRPPASPSTGEG